MRVLKPAVTSMFEAGTFSSSRLSAKFASRVAAATRRLFKTSPTSSFSNPSEWVTKLWLSSAPKSSKATISLLSQTQKRSYSRPNWYDGDRGNYSNNSPFTNFFSRFSLHPAVVAILSANVGVWLLWMSYGNTPGGRRDMQQQLSVSVRNIEQGRVWTLLTTAVSIDNGWGLLFNGITLYFLGNEVANHLGTKYFVPIYFGSAAAAGLAHVAYHYSAAINEPSQSRRLYNRHVSMQGASAAVMSIAAAYAVMFPTRQILFYGVLPVPAALLVGGLFAYTLYQGATTGRPIIGDVVGPLVGALAAFALRRRF